MLLAATLALAAEATSPGSIEVQMPAVEIKVSPRGRSGWSRVPDGMAVEMALARYDLRLDDISAITVTTTGEGTRLDWFEPASGDVRMRVDGRRRRKVCTDMLRGGIWTGGSDVVVYDPTASGVDDRAADPGFFLVEDDLRIGALVSLAPGNAVTVFDLRFDGRLVREVVQVERASGTVRLERQKDAERICFVAPD